jgi:hypothetical protein
MQHWVLRPLVAHAPAIPLRQIDVGGAHVVRIQRDQVAKQMSFYRRHTIRAYNSTYQKVECPHTKVYATPSKIHKQDSMEFEEKVANTLRDMGYPIFYRDVTITYTKKFVMGEFDIVSRDFIVEVKSGRDITTRGIDLMSSQGLLPTGFAVYIYCPRFSDAEIAELNHDLYRPNITFINDLAVIRKHHEPVNECTVASASLFMRLLRTPLTDILQFQRIYMTTFTFLRVYRNVSYMRDLYSKREGIMWSEKIMTLIAGNRIEIVNVLPDTVPPLIGCHKLSYTRRFCIWDMSKPIALPICHNINKMTRLNDITEISYASNRVYKSMTLG